MRILNNKSTFVYITVMICIVLYNIYFPSVAYAMGPKDNNHILDYYGQIEYTGIDVYGHYNNLTFNIDKPIIPELEDTSNTRVTIHELEGSPKFYNESSLPIYEMNAMSMDGTMSTEIFDRELFQSRFEEQKRCIEYCRNFQLDEPSFFEKISVAYRKVDENITFICIKATEISKRKIYWTVWAKGKGKYDSYKEFKKTWSSSTGFWSRLEKSMKADIHSEVKSLLGYNNLKKEMKKSVRKEVEKALKINNPFIK